MVVNNADPESGGGKEGVLALAAIAIVLFFVIRIYADYVTATGQAVKPGLKRQAAARSSSGGSSANEDPLEWPSTGRSKEDAADGEWKSPPPVKSAHPAEEISSDRTPINDRRRQLPDEALSGDTREHPPRTKFPGQIVIERVPGEADDTLMARTVARKPRAGAPPPPQPIDEPGRGEASLGTGAASAPRTALFHPSTPYPGLYDDVQVGDRLSEISELRLPRGRLSRSVYSYHPKGGPFKTIYAMLAVGPIDPPVTGLVYLFRNPGREAEVHRQAVEVFGEGDVVPTSRGERRQWPHLDGYTVSIERDRYMVEQDLSAAGRRLARRRGTAAQE